MDIPGTHTLNPGNLLWLLFIGRPDQMTSIGTRCRKHSLKFEAGDDIGRTMIAIDIVDLRIEDFTPRRNDDGTSLDAQLSLFILEIDGLRRTELFTDSASPLYEKEAVGRINGILQGNRLGILYMDRLALAETCIIFVIDLGRTFLRAEATGDTLRHIHITGILDYFDFKISFLPGDTLHL